MDKLLKNLTAQNFDALDEAQLNSIEIYINGLQTKLNEAKKIRGINCKQEKWNKVKEAITTYVEAYDGILVEDGYEGYYIDKNYSFDECGKIVGF